MEDQLAASILVLLAQRRPDATICPSEAARVVADGDDWRALMEPARRAAARLADAGQVEVTQGGEVAFSVMARFSRSSLRSVTSAGVLADPADARR